MQVTNTPAGGDNVHCDELSGTSQLLYVKCQPSDLRVTDRKTPQIGQVVFISGIRVETVGSIHGDEVSIPLHAVVSALLSRANVPSEQHSPQQQQQQQQQQQLVVASIIPEDGYESATKQHWGILNISAIASLVTSPGLFSPLISFGDIFSIVRRGTAVNSLLTVVCTIAFSKRLDTIDKCLSPEEEGKNALHLCLNTATTISACMSYCTHY